MHVFVTVNWTPYLEGLYTLLFAHVKISTDQQLHQAYKEIEAMISQLN